MQTLLFPPVNAQATAPNSLSVSLEESAEASDAKS